MLRWTAHPTVWHYQCHNFGVKTAYPIRVGRRVGHILNARVASSSHSIAVLSIARTGPGTEFIEIDHGLLQEIPGVGVGL